MLKEISWSDYWLTIIVVCAVYEMIIVLLFFRKDASQLMYKVSNGRQGKSETSRAGNSGIQKGMTLDTSADQKESERLVHQSASIIGAIRNFIIDVAERSFVKEEVIMGLQIIVRDNRNLMNTSFQQSISDCILDECSNHLEIQLSPEEIRMIWMG